VFDRSSWRTRYVSPSAPFQLEVPVVGCQPRVEHFRNGDAAVTEDKRAWRLLAAMAGVTLDANAEEAFFGQVRSPYGVAAQNQCPSSTNQGRG
jgi:hypothetical protein